LPKRLGTVGGRQRWAVAAEELHSKFSLERPDPLAHSGGCNPKFESGAGEIAVPGARSQHAQRIKRGQSLGHESFKAVLQMIVKAYRRDAESDPLHWLQRHNALEG
jgi:hypothetical protein